MKKHTLEQIYNKATEIYKIPTLSACYSEIDGTKLAVETDWNQLDLERNEQNKFSKRYLFEIKHDNKTLTLTDVSKPMPIRSDIWRSKSLNNSLTAVISNWKDKTEDKQFLEIWNNESRISNINLTKLSKHEKLYENSIVWSQSSTQLAYLAEIKNTRKESSFFTSNVQTSLSDSVTDSLSENNVQEKYANVYKDEWGEQLVGKSQSVIAVFDTKSSEVKILENLPKDVCAWNLCWYKDDGIVFSAYYTKPFRLGLVYCPIRKGDLFYYDLKEKKCIQLTDSKESVRDPRFSHDYKNLCWLQNTAGGPHFKCSKLMLMDWSTKNTNTIVDIVNAPNGNDFCGIYTQNLLNNCWSLDNKRVVLSTQMNHKTRVISCDIETKVVRVLDTGLNDLNYAESLNFSNDWISGVLQSYNKKPTLIVAKLPEKGREKEIKWNFLSTEEDELELIAQVDLLKFEPNYINIKYPKVNFEAILAQPKQPSDILVVFPHGGPHSAYQCEYNPHVAILYSLGYSVLLVNYRGTSGYGEDSINSLPGDIGSQDVKDCQQAAEYCVKHFSFKKSVLYGGSHGGFLTCHLIGQYPDWYAAAACRNPVTQLESMRSTSDIPDWIFVEALGQYDYDPKYIGEAQIHQLFIDKSPIKYVDAVKTPIMLMTGSVDLRVPQRQSVEYYRALLARDKTAWMLVFKEDNHTLGKPQTTGDCIINAILWYEKYI